MRTMKSITAAILTIFIVVTLCKKNVRVFEKPTEIKISIDTIQLEKDSLAIEKTPKLNLDELNDSTFVSLRVIDSTFIYDLKYATLDNFLKEKVYDCDDCLLRYATIKKLLKAHNEFKKLGYKIKFFDCYRPLSIQRKMWEIYPDKRYVADPKKGSNHNRGTAVDITLVDSLGVELEMGTDFDHFGNKAHHAYTHLPKQTLENRKLLKSVMGSHGFWSITSEWWHYNLNASYKYKVSDFKTECVD